MKEIQLTRGKIALVDDSDFEELNQFKWFAWTNKKGHWYAHRNTARSKGKQTTIKMHRAILNLKADQLTDHKNGNGLDNRRENIRACSRAENNRNKRLGTQNSSGLKGASFHRPNGKWQSAICVNYKTIFLGFFSVKEDAARAYDAAALKYHGKFANLNFPLEAECSIH